MYWIEIQKNKPPLRVARHASAFKQESVLLGRFFYCCIGNNSSTLTEDSSVLRLRAEEYQQRLFLALFINRRLVNTPNFASAEEIHPLLLVSFNVCAFLYEFELTEKLQTGCLVLVGWFICCFDSVCVVWEFERRRYCDSVVINNKHPVTVLAC